MIYLISDLHLDHKSIISYCNRPFSSVEEMNRTIIDNRNKVVKEDDFVYLASNLGLGRKKTKNTVLAEKRNKKFLKNEE